MTAIFQSLEASVRHRSRKPDAILEWLENIFGAPDDECRNVELLDFARPRRQLFRFQGACRTKVGKASIDTMEWAFVSRDQFWSDPISMYHPPRKSFRQALGEVKIGFPQDAIPYRILQPRYTGFGERIVCNGIHKDEALRDLRTISTDQLSNAAADVMADDCTALPS
jgi:hypothetical protein